MSFLQAAFDTVIADASRPQVWYVALLEEVPYYMPWEGGTWCSDIHVVAFREYPTEELALAAAEAVRKLAKELEADAQREFGEQCLRELDWLESRGLDSDFLPEPDGESRFYVRVSEALPTGSYGPRHYE